MVTRYKKESGRKIFFRGSGRILVNGKFYNTFTNFERYARNKKDFIFLIKFNLITGFDIKRAFIEVEFSKFEENPSK